MDLPTVYESGNGILRIGYGDSWFKGFVIYLSLPTVDEVVEKRILAADIAKAEAIGTPVLLSIAKKLSEKGYVFKRNGQEEVHLERFERTPNILDALLPDRDAVVAKIDDFQLDFKDAYEAALRENKSAAAYMSQGQRPRKA